MNTLDSHWFGGTFPFFSTLRCIQVLRVRGKNGLKLKPWQSWKANEACWQSHLCQHFEHDAHIMSWISHQRFIIHPRSFFCARISLEHNSNPGPWEVCLVSEAWNFWESSHHWGKNAAMPWCLLKKTSAVGWFFSGHSQSPDLRLQSVQMHFTQKSYVKRNQEEIDYDECFYWRRSTWRSSHANSLLQVGHCLKDNPAQLASLYSLGRGYGAVVVTMLMSRPLLEDLAMFRRDLFRNQPCNKLEMPGGSEWNCPKCRSSLCVGILEDEVLI